jgi:glutamine amidotransferase
MVAILKYNAGNIRSVENAMKRLGVEAVISDNPEVLQAAEKMIFPGVGEASSAMHYLKERGLDEVIRGLTQPVLGICLGLQLMCSWSEEGDTQGLGIFSEKVLRFPPEDKVPHMGWNSFVSLQGELFEGISVEDDVYYVHSFFAATGQDTSAVCDYIRPFSAAMQKDNFYAVQFHPEKSAGIGERILQNFLQL